MKIVEIEQALSDLADQPLDSVEFPFQFLQAFGNKETTLKKLRTGNTNKSDLGGVLQTNKYDPNALKWYVRAKGLKNKGHDKALKLDYKPHMS